MFLFWYKFVQTNLNMINIGLGEVLYESIEKNLNDYMGDVFEKISIEYFEERLKKSKFLFIPTDYGNWWGTDKELKKESEIDMLAYNNENEFLFVEAKWNNSKVKQDILDNLISKSYNFRYKKAYYWITSLSGFEKFKIEDNVELVDIGKMYKI